MADEDRWRGSARDNNQNQWRDEDRFGGYGRDRDENRGNWRRGQGAEGQSQDWNRNVAYGGGRENQGNDWNWNRRGNDDFSNRDFGGENRNSGYGNAGIQRGFGNDEPSYGSGQFRGGEYGDSYRGRYGSNPDPRHFNQGRDFWDRASDEVSSWFGDRDAEGRREGDARQGDSGAQHHVGRGPKGYTRSDERIREDVSDRLSDDRYVDASDIEVTVSNREVTLSGTVDSRNAKRRAEDIAESVSAVSHVSNNLRVRDRNAASTTGSTASGSGFLGGTGSV